MIFSLEGMCYCFLFLRNLLKYCGVNNVGMFFFVGPGWMYVPLFKNSLHCWMYVCSIVGGIVYGLYNFDWWMYFARWMFR